MDLDLDSTTQAVSHPVRCGWGSRPGQGPAIASEVMFWDHLADSVVIGLYTDESPGLKVDPVVVLVLSLVFIFSVVALHSTFFPNQPLWHEGSAFRSKQRTNELIRGSSYRQDYSQVLGLKGPTGTDENPWMSSWSGDTEMRSTRGGRRINTS